MSYIFFGHFDKAMKIHVEYPERETTDTISHHTVTLTAYPPVQKYKVGQMIKITYLTFYKYIATVRQYFIWTSQTGTVDE